MISIKKKEVHSFFYSQAFSDGLRSTIAILIPALIGSYTNNFELGITVSLGAMLVSLTDSPGPLLHKKNGMLFCTFFVFLVAIITSAARTNTIAMGLEIAFVTFLFSMFTVYGNRAIGVGNAAILVMILTMDSPVPQSQILEHAVLITIGCIFYSLLSISLYKIQPYRFAQRALGDCTRQMAEYLSIKSDFYDPATNLPDDYNRLVAQQVVVHEKQDAVRELLFKTRQIVNENTVTGRKLMYTFIEAVDLFEHITAISYDYSILRDQFAGTGILEKISDLIKRMANELDNMGIAIQANSIFTSSIDYDAELVALKNQINELEPEGHHTHVLKRVLVNIRRLLNGFSSVTLYFKDVDLKSNKVDPSHFISHQSLNPKILFDNLTFQSGIFKHALRVCIACIAGFTITKLLAYGHHSYWVLLTVAFILKPAFSLTKQRNVERIIGTVIGGTIGLGIIVFIPNKTAQFIFMVLFMLGTYSFMRIRYLIMVICTTPYVLILFNFLGVPFLQVAGERVIDTLIGCSIAFTASYVLFPYWEVMQLRRHISNMLVANIHYFSNVLHALAGEKPSELEYKVSRKEVYVASANLSAAFQRMLSEPKNRQSNEKQLQQFVVLSHILFSNIATLGSSLLLTKRTLPAAEVYPSALRAFDRLKKAALKIDPDAHFPSPPKTVSVNHEGSATDVKLLKDQIEFILRISTDIEKSVSSFVPEPNQSQLVAA
jgi:uncharacterized membrane protein (TIGR01666 family)